MTTYYVRHDGTQTNKANAVVGGSASQALSLAGFNGETFAAGDEIIFERSGPYTGVIQVAGTGTAEAPIVVRGPGPLEAQHAVVNVTGQNGISITGDHLHVKNFSISATDNKCVFIGNASGIGGYTVKVFDCIAVQNAGGDGFGTNSTASDVSEVEFVRCEARAITGLNNQGFTHHVDQKIILTDCRTTRACEYAMVMIGNECIVNGGEFFAIDTIFQFGDACIATLNNVTAVADVGANSRLITIGTDGTRATFNNCDLKQLAPSTRNNSLINNSVGITFNGGRLEYAGGATSGFEWSTAGASGGVLTFRGVRITLGTMGARFARTLTSGGAVVVEGCLIDMRRVAGGATINVFEIRNTSNGLLSSFTANVVIGNDLANLVFVRCPVSMVSPVLVANNVFVGILGANADVILNQLGTATATITVRNNLFHSCADAIAGTVGLTADSNNFSGGTPVETDANASTDEPHFVGGLLPQNAEGYRLPESSPLVRSGAVVVGLRDFTGRPFGARPTRGAFEVERMPQAVRR